MAEAGSMRPISGQCSGEQSADLRGAQTSEGVNKTDAGIKLRVAGQPLLDPRHADQDKADFASIEQIAELLQTRDLESTGFVNKDQAGWSKARPRRDPGDLRDRRC